MINAVNAANNVGVVDPQHGRLFRTFHEDKYCVEANNIVRVYYDSYILNDRVTVVARASLRVVDPITDIISWRDMGRLPLNPKVTRTVTDKYRDDAYQCLSRMYSN